MKRTKKYKIGEEALLEKLINLELKSYKVTYQDVKKEKQGKKNPWYQRYTFNSTKEYNKWKTACMKILTTQTIPKLSKKIAEREFLYLDLMYGLSCRFK